MSAHDRDVLTCILADAARHARQCRIDHVSSKGQHDYVTNVDGELDAIVTKRLEAEFPGLKVFSEERPIDLSTAGDAYWLIDPLDGTHNFLSGLTQCAVAAALIDKNAPSLSGVADVGTGEVYVAERSEGAWVAGTRLSLPAEPSELMALSTNAIDSLMDHAAAYNALRQHGKLRIFGSQALHLVGVARGKFSLAASREAKLWDDAPGRLIAEEAGARYVAFGPKPGLTDLANISMKSVCTHPKVFDEASRIFSSIWAA